MAHALFCCIAMHKVARIYPWYFARAVIKVPNIIDEKEK